jgi:hypothetical protein
MEFAELSRAATLSRTAFFEKVPHALLISVTGDDDDTNAQFQTPSGGTPIGDFATGKVVAKAQSADSVLADHTPGQATRPQRRDDETFRRAEIMLNQSSESDVEDVAVSEASSVTLAIQQKSDSLLCLPLVKSARNPFGQMLTVGRTPNNDIVLKETGVSKFHAYFTQRGDVWWVHDQGSTNGTFVDQKRIDAKGVALANGTRVAFGQKMRFRFYTPAGIYSVLTGK